MLTAYRAFEANQKVLQAYDRTMEKAANEIGRIG
jgi:flagellar basal-body rod protein FlgF